MNLALAFILLFGAPAFPVAQEAPVAAVQEKPILVLYYSSYCPYSQKVLRYLKNIHKTVPMKEVTENPQYKKELSRAGDQVVPCLIIDGKAVYDADAIIDWLSKHQDQLEAS